MNENNAYILGTDKEELHRLEIQHKIWKSEARTGWKIAEFKSGQRLLDLGCGPGLCTVELANVAGESGKVIGVDQSESFINYLTQIKLKHQLSIEPKLTDFNTLSLEPSSIDGVYCRWALAWTPNPKKVLSSIKTFLKPGGRMVIQEYFYWASHQTQPQRPGLKKAIAAALKSFKESDSEIDVGRHLSQWFEELGMKIINKRLMSKLATPDSLTWQWPKTFYQSYFPRLAKMEYLTKENVKEALNDIEVLEQLSYSTICCPLMIEVVAEK